MTTLPPRLQDELAGALGDGWLTDPSERLAYAYDNFDNRTMYGLILFVLCIAIAFNLLVFAYERRLARQRGL